MRLLIQDEELDTAAQFLFDRLVGSGHASPVGAETLKHKCDEILVHAGIAHRDNFQENFKLPIFWDGFERELTFHYGIGNEALFMRVAITAEQSVTSAAYKFEWAERQTHIAKNRRFTLFAPQPEIEEGDNTNVRLLEQFSTTINVSSREAALSMLRPLAASHRTQAGAECPLFYGQSILI